MLDFHIVYFSQDEKDYDFVVHSVSEPGEPDEKAMPIKLNPYAGTDFFKNVNLDDLLKSGSPLDKIKRHQDAEFRSKFFETSRREAILYVLAKKCFLKVTNPSFGELSFEFEVQIPNIYNLQKIDYVNLENILTPIYGPQSTM